MNQSPNDHTIYGNRSASYHNISQFEEALADGEKCIEINHRWGKGYMRKGMALHSLGRLQEALDTYKRGVQLDPDNAQMKAGIVSVKRDIEQAAFYT